MTNSKETQQRIEGDFDALFVAAKGRRMKFAPLCPAPGSLYSLISDLPICLLCRTPRQMHELSQLIFVCKS